jgi:hypothetical protein
MESQRMEAEHRARHVPEMACIARELMGPEGYLSLNMAVLRRNIAPVIEYVNKHLALDNDRDVAETMKDLPWLIHEMEMVIDQLRQVAHGLNAQALSGEMQRSSVMIALLAHLVPLIEQRIAELLASTDPLLRDHRSLATHYGVLPIYTDMGGCLALKPTGEWLFFHHDQRGGALE